MIIKPIAKHVCVMLLLGCANAYAVETVPLTPPSPASGESSTTTVTTASSSVPNISEIPKLDWFFLSHALAFYKPDIRASSGLVHIYAYQKNCDAYTKASKNEFDLAEIMAKYKADSEKYATEKPRRTFFDLEMQLGEYDHERKGFPIQWQEDVSWRLNPSNAPLDQRCYGFRSVKFDSTQIPNEFYVKFMKDSEPAFMPMEPAQARALLEKQKNQRNIEVGMIVEITGFETDTSGYSRRGVFTIQPVWAGFRSPNSETWLATLDESALTLGRGNLEAERQQLALKREEEAIAKQAQEVIQRLAYEQKQMESRREYFIKSYQENIKSKIDGASPAQRTALLTMADFNGFTQIGDALLYNMRTQEAPTTTFLVQSRSSGRKDIEARWPGRLRMNVAEPMEGFKGDAWYIVQGKVSAASPRENVIDANIDVTNLYACKEKGCTDFENSASVDERIQALAKEQANKEYPEIKGNAQESKP